MKKFITFLIVLFSITCVGCSNNVNTINDDNSNKNSKTITNKFDEKKNDNKNVNSGNAIKSESSSKDTVKTETNKSENTTATTAPKPTEEKVIVATPKENPYPSEAELMLLVYEGESALKRIFKGSAYFSTEMIERNNRTYGEISEFTSRQEMVNVLSPYFTMDTINSLLDQYLLIENGKLYFTIGDCGVRVDYANCEKKFEYANNSITITLSKKFAEDYVATEVKNLQLIDGKWLFTNFWYV